MKKEARSPRRAGQGRAGRGRAEQGRAKQGLAVQRRAEQGRAERPRAEQRFFTDPAVDGLMGVLMTLATDHYVLRDRVQALEEQLVRSGHVDARVLQSAPSAAEMAAENDAAAAFVTELLRPLLGLQDAVGVGGPFSLKKQRRRTRP